MRLSRKYLAAVALLAVLAAVFGVVGTFAPPMAETVAPNPEAESSSDSVAHFINPPTYDSRWVNITDKCGQHVTLTHNLGTMDITVDITGRTANLTEENWHQFWSMGDVNRDGYIDDTDGDLISAAWGSRPGDPNWNPDADLDQDGHVWAEDLSIYGRNHGKDIWTYFGAGTHQRHLDLTCYTPGWTQAYGLTEGVTTRDYCSSVVQTRDGGYAIAGETQVYGGGRAEDCWLVKTDSCGTEQWSKTYGETYRDQFWSVIQTDDEGYVLAGNTIRNGTNGDDFYLVSTDDFGNKLWERTYGETLSDFAESVVETSDEGYAIAGTVNFGFGNSNFWLVKTDSSGIVQWSRTYGGAYDDVCRSMVQTSDGGYALAGETYSYVTSPDHTDFWLVKTDWMGYEQWRKNYGGPDDDAAYSVVQTIDGGYALAGYTYSYGTGAPTYSDFWLVKTDWLGTPQWNKTYGGALGEAARSVVQTSDGGYALAGSTGSYGVQSDFWLVKTDWLGATQWSKAYGGANYDHCRSVVETSDGGYALAGYRDWYESDGFSYNHGWFVKTNVESGLAWTDSTSRTVTLYRGRTDPYWNFVRVRVWTTEEPTWQYGDINQDGIVDARDLYILSRNYGKTFSLLSLTGIIAIAGIHTYKKRKQPT